MSNGWRLREIVRPATVSVVYMLCFRLMQQRELVYAFNVLRTGISMG